jgi:hypothetical protein
MLFAASRWSPREPNDGTWCTQQRRHAGAPQVGARPESALGAAHGLAVQPGAEHIQGPRAVVGVLDVLGSLGHGDSTLLALVQQYERGLADGLCDGDDPILRPGAQGRCTGAA